MINKVSMIGGITSDKHRVNETHKKKHNESHTVSFQSILDKEKRKYDERLSNENIKRVQLINKKECGKNE